MASVGQLVLEVDLLRHQAGVLIVQPVEPLLELGQVAQLLLVVDDLGAQALVGSFELRDVRDDLGHGGQAWVGRQLDGLGQLLTVDGDA